MYNSQTFATEDDIGMSKQSCLVKWQMMFFFEVESFTEAFQKTKKPSNLTYRNLVATKSEKPRASQTKWYRDCDLIEEEIDWKKHANKPPKLLFSNLNFSIDVCAQIPFFIRLQFKIMIFAPFIRKKQTLCSISSGNARWPLFSQWLQSCSLIQKGNHLVMTTALGLKPDSSNTKLQLNFSCLMTIYCIWTSKLRDEIPKLPQFFRLLKKTYETETNELNLQPEKWKPLLGHL